MAKILLIRTRMESQDYPYGAPPLGLLYVASYLRLNPAHQVKILDMRATLMLPEEASDLVRDFAPDIVGISSLSLEESILNKTARAIKEWRSDCPVVVGGPHVNSAKEKLLCNRDIDYLVLGEGETTFPELVQVIAEKADPQQVEGIAYLRNGEVVKTAPRPFMEDLDALLFPSWDLIDLKTYYNLPRFMRFSPVAGVPFMPVMTSRGCPYNCVYCHNIMGKRFRARSAENVFKELKTLYDDYGIAEFEFIDDCFNLDKKRVHQLCDMITSSGMKVKMCFPNGLRGDILDEPTLRKLKDAGTTEISFAPETGSERIQKLIRKNANLPKLQEAITAAVKVGIHAHGFFMLGFPSETKEDLDQTLEFVRKTKLHTADFFIVNVFPDTELFEMVKAMGRDVPQSYDSIDFHNTEFNVSDVSTKELLSYQRKFFMTFYLRPLRILRLFTSPSIKKRYLFYYAWLFFQRTVLRKR